jgi:hypothetical protein
MQKMTRYRPWLNSYQCTEYNLNVGSSALTVSNNYYGTNLNMGLIVVLLRDRNKQKSYLIRPKKIQRTRCYY